MGAGDHRAYRRPGNVLKSDSYCCCRSFYDCGLIGTALAVCRGSNGRRLIRYALLPAAASRPYCYCDNFEANLGTTLLYGLIITIPTVIVAGPLFSKLLARFEKAPPEGLFNPHLFSEEEMPSFWNSIFAAVIPVILMAIAAVCEITLPKRMPCGFSSNLSVIQQWRCLLPLSSPFYAGPTQRTYG